MYRDINLLRPLFKSKLKKVLGECKKKGYILVPFCTRRNVYEQAKLYRQSRTWKEIESTINRYREERAIYLADVLVGVGPQYGRWVTNAPPGLSWHQWDLACDCYLLDSDDSANWDATASGYWMFYQNLIKEGLLSGYTFKDVVHCQKRMNPPTFYFSLKKISSIMEEKYN